MYIDTHLDTMYQSLDSGRAFKTTSDEGHVDLHRARQADLFVGFFTGFPTSSQYITEKMMRNWLEFYIHSDSNINQVTDLTSLQEHENHFRNSARDKRNIGAVLHFEGATGIDTELHRLYIYHGLGLRSMSLTWNEENQFATGVRDGDPKRGLTTEGKDLLDAMETLGILIDISHLNDQSFWDVADHTNKPIFASHSNLRSVCNHGRNLTDEMVQIVIDSGGSIGVNFCKGFLNDDPNSASMSDALHMMERIIELGGVDHLHIGSDFDGCTLPQEIEGINTIPSLLSQLQSRLDLSTVELDKIKHKNMMRVMQSYWD